MTPLTDMELTIDTGRIDAAVAEALIRFLSEDCCQRRPELCAGLGALETVATDA